MAVFWDAAQCILVDIDRRFRGDYKAQYPRRQPSSQWLMVPQTVFRYATGFSKQQLCSAVSSKLMPILHASTPGLYTHPFISLRLRLRCLIHRWGNFAPYFFYVLCYYFFVCSLMYFFLFTLEICPVILVAHLYHTCADVVLWTLFTMCNHPLDPSNTLPVSPSWQDAETGPVLFSKYYLKLIICIPMLTSSSERNGK
jgi:hypothetical protein